jgi:hypothetical protein
MKTTYWLGLALIVSLIGLLGCQERPDVPTPEPEPTEAVVVIVVTATSQPTLEPTDTPEPSITPIPTLTPIATLTVTSTVPATAAPRPTTAAATSVPAPNSVEVPTQPAPEATQPPSSFPAPLALAPSGLNVTPGQSIPFQFTSVGPLGPDQCYRIDMVLTHPAGSGPVDDYWLDLCGDSSAAGTPLTIAVGRFTDANNYVTVLANAEAILDPTPFYTMGWSVMVVRIIDASDPIHPTTESLSPASASLENTFSR